MTSFQKLLEQAEQGNLDAYVDVGICYMTGDGTPTNHQEGIVWLRKAAQAKHPRGLYNYGYAHEAGAGVVRNERKAAEYYRAAADLGLAVAQFQLGYCHMTETGVSRDVILAIYWYDKAAKQDYPGNPPTEPREPEVEFSRNGGSSTCASPSSPTARSWLCSNVPRSAKRSLISAAS